MNTKQKVKRSVIFMNQIKFLLFVVLLLTTTGNAFGQNKNGLVTDFKNTINNIKKEIEFSNAVEHNKEVNPDEFRDASVRTVLIVFNHAVNKNNYEAAKIMLDYLYSNKYDKKLITKHKTMAMGRVIDQNKHFVKREGKNCYFKYDVREIEKWSKLLIDKSTNLEYLFEKTVAIPSYSFYERFTALNASEVIKILRESKYR